MRIEIVILGLCSIVNPDGQSVFFSPTPDNPGRTYYSPRAVVMPRHKGHYSFVGFDETQTRLLKPLKSDQTFSKDPNLKMLDLPHGQLSVTPDITSSSFPVDPSFAKVARFGEFSGVTAPVWNPALVPENGVVSGNDIAVYWKLGGGTLGVERHHIPSTQWYFKPEADAASKDGLREIARASTYSFDITVAPENARLTLVVVGASGKVAREMIFAPAFGSKRIRIFLGNSSGWGEEMSNSYLGPRPAVHFRRYYDFISNAPPPRDRPIPHPDGVAIYNAQLGYCGPEQLP